MRARVGVATLAVALTAAACDDDPGPSPLDEGRPPAEAAVAIGLEASSLGSGIGEWIAVAVRADGPDAPAALQGHLYFDADRLRYAGQVPGDFLVIVNEREAARGHLQLASLDVAGLPARTAVLTFEVLAPEYDRGLRYVSVEVVSQAVELVSADVRREITVAGDLRADDAVHMSLADWKERLYADQVDVVRAPGEYRLNLVYGDANLSGGLSTFDAAVTANAAVGNNELIIGSDAVDRDYVVAANVRPSNLPGLGEAGDVPPGLEANGTRVITTLDAAAIANEAPPVGNPQAIVGELIPGRGPLPSNRVIVTGQITSDVTWTKGNVYELQGVVDVTNGATLTIQEGTLIEGSTQITPSALIVLRDARIVAQGTALEPIVFTCSGTKAPGCWGGLVVIGNTTLPEAAAGLPASPAITGRSVGGCAQRPVEGLPADPKYYYGGCNDTDSSGVLRYMRLEYGGFILSGNNELNGLTLPAVGSGTDIDHIQVHGGLDDAVELFGGTVDLKYLYLTANSDDNFDCSFGYRGRTQFVIIQHDSLDADKGIECDNTETAATYNNEPRVRGKLWNFTFVGRESPTGTGGVSGNNSNDAFHLRRGTRPQLRNFLVIGARVVLDIDDAATCDTELNGTGTGGEGLALKNSLIAGAGTVGNTDADPTCAPYNTGTFTGSNLEQLLIDDATNGVTTLASAAGLLKAPYDVLLPDFRPVAGSAAATFVGATPPNDGFFDVTATYPGAVAPENAFSSNIPWYSGWTRGWQSATQK
jgi:hypothetical protein